MNVRWTVGTGAGGAAEVVVYGDLDWSVEDALHTALHERNTTEVIISRVSGPVARLFEVAGFTECLLSACNGDVHSPPDP